MKLVYFQGGVLFAIFWDADNAQQAKGGSHSYPFVFFEMFVFVRPCKTASAKVPKFKIARTKVQVAR